MESYACVDEKGDILYICRENELWKYITDDINYFKLNKETLEKFKDSESNKFSPDIEIINASIRDEILCESDDSSMPILISKINYNKYLGNKIPEKYFKPDKGKSKAYDGDNFPNISFEDIFSLSKTKRKLYYFKILIKNNRLDLFDRLYELCPIKNPAITYEACKVGEEALDHMLKLDIPLHTHCYHIAVLKDDIWLYDKLIRNNCPKTKENMDHIIDNGKCVDWISTFIKDEFPLSQRALFYIIEHTECKISIKSHLHNDETNLITHCVKCDKKYLFEEIIHNKESLDFTKIIERCAEYTQFVDYFNILKGFDEFTFSIPYSLYYACQHDNDELATAILSDNPGWLYEKKLRLKWFEQVVMRFLSINTYLKFCKKPRKKVMSYLYYSGVDVPNKERYVENNPKHINLRTIYNWRKTKKYPHFIDSKITYKIWRYNPDPTIANYRVLNE